jgi:hypothetical protein
MYRKNVCRVWYALSAAFAVAGCADNSGLPTRYPVSGTVTYNGEPLQQGTINFAPVDGSGRAAGGTISAGRYSLTTHDPNVGALP